VQLQERVCGTRGKLPPSRRYAWGFAPIRAILLLLSVANLLGMPYQVLMPVFATEVLHGDAHTLGMLTVASGVGAIIGAL